MPMMIPMKEADMSTTNDSQTKERKILNWVIPIEREIPMYTRLSSMLAMVLEMSEKKQMTNPRTNTMKKYAEIKVSAFLVAAVSSKVIK